MKLVVLDGNTLNPGDLSWDALAGFGELTVYDRTPKELAAERIGNAEIAFTNKTILTEEALRACPRLRYIGTFSTGYNTIDIDAAHALSIVVSNIPAYATEAVGQHVFALLLEITNRTAEHHNSIKAGAWVKSADFCYWTNRLMELQGKTMGILGFGRIGQYTAKLADAFGMQVVYYNPTPKASGNPRFTPLPLADFWGACDVISLHCPLFPETEHIINLNTIALMRDGVIIINTSRGPLIQEQDLAEALHSGKVYAAGCDVVSREPILPDNPLLSAPNVILTPHTAWAARETRQRCMDTAISNLKAYLAGAPVNTVKK